MKPPKLANIESVGDFSHWLADTIQGKVSKEDAGFVQIQRGGLGERIVVANGLKTFEMKIEEVLS